MTLYALITSIIFYVTMHETIPTSIESWQSGGCTMEETNNGSKIFTCEVGQFEIHDWEQFK